MMKPERLAEIRRRLSDDIDVGDPYDVIYELAGDADDLLAEVDRLREGIEALASDHEDISSSALESPGFHSAHDHAAEDLRELLNPTQGEK